MSTISHIEAIARREASVRVRTRTFVLGTVFVVIGVVAIALVPVIVQYIEGNATQRVTVYVGATDLGADPVPTLRSLLNATPSTGTAGAAPSTHEAVIITTSTDLAAARSEVTEGRANAVLAIERGSDGELAFTLYTNDPATGRTVDWPADSTLRIATVIEPTLLFVGVPMTGCLGFSPPEVDVEITAYQQEQVTKAARNLRSAHRMVEGIVLCGRPATALVEEATRFGADLVMGGSRGRGTISSLLLGSVSAEVVDYAPCPVLVSRTPSINRVIFATDGSVPSAAAETVLSTWLIFEGLPIHVVSVADVMEPWHTGIAPTMYRQVIEAHARDLAEARAEHTRIAEETTARLRAHGRKAEGVMRTGDAAGEIISAAAEVSADMVVIGSRGRSGFARVVLGSVARNVLHGSTASVLVIHKPKPSDAAGP